MTPGRIIALVLSRAAAGLGGALAGIGIVHVVLAGNIWGIPPMLVGLALLLYGIRQAARIDRDG